MTDRQYYCSDSKTDSSWLYDVSLVIGTSLNLHANCESVLETLVAQSRFECAAVWFKDQFLSAQEQNGWSTLLCAVPVSCITLRRLPSDHPLFDLSERYEHEVVMGVPAKRAVAELFATPLDADRVPLVVALGELGSLALVVRSPLTDEERFQFQRLMGAFTFSLEMCLQHEREVARGVRLEKALAMMRAQAQQTAWLRPSFLGYIGYEIRTSMNGIIGMTDLLLKTPLDGEQREFTAIIRDEAHMLLRLIDSMMKLARVEAGIHSAEVTAFNIEEVIASAIDIVAPRAGAKDLALLSEIEAELPLWVRGDVRRIRRVLLELVDNAVTYTDRGEVRIIAERYAATDGALTVRFSVEDTGPGITETAYDRLFDPFAKDRIAFHKTSGAGLGLVIAKRLVEQGGGTIGVESEAGNGSVFWFTLPLEVATPVPSRAAVPVLSSS